MEEFFLCGYFPSDKMDIIDKEDVNVTVFLAESLG